jgi:DNA-binding ferritin-like protein
MLQVTETYGTKCLEKTIEGLRQSLKWAKDGLEVALAEADKQTKEIIKIENLIEEVEKDLSILRNY